MRHGISKILTFNSADFARYPQVTAIAPNSVDASSGALTPNLVDVK